MEQTSYLIRHIQCPSCAALGRDRRKNNLGVYSDGHQWCFACGYWQAGDVIKAFTQQNSPIETTDKVIYLPNDVTTELPTMCKRFLEQYGFDILDIKSNHIMWSEYYQRLIFPYFINGNLVAWQGRTFNEETKKSGKKWFSQGDLKSILYILNRQEEKLVLVESIISAIKLAKLGYCSSPIWGSVIPDIKKKIIASQYKHIVLWNDPDKLDVAIKEANKFRLYIPQVDVILSKDKPKDTSIEDIKNVYLF